MKKVIFTAITLSLILNPYIAFAQEYVISGNGEGSSSSIEVSVTTETNVEQNNTADIVNEVEITADTGGNSADANTGEEVNIDTGDISVTSNVENTNINQSIVDIGACCPESTNIEVSENGSNSINSVSYSNNNTTNVSVNNSASITNNVNGNANTGNNNANYNTGNVDITTGSIYVADNIVNKSINIYKVDAKSGNNGSANILVKGNGANSTNLVNIVNNTNSVNVNIQNSARIVNNSNWNLNTGNNSANGNVGDVKIATGDIVFLSNVKNDGINAGYVDIECCPSGGPTEPEKPIEPEKPVDPNPPVNPLDGGDNKVASSGNGGVSADDNGAAGGDLLPETGSYDLLILLLAGIAMFALGGYMRYKSGPFLSLAV